MRKINQPPPTSSIVILGVKHYKVGSIGYYSKDNDIWWIWAPDFSKFESRMPSNELDRGDYCWRPVEDNLLAGWEYLGAGSVGLKGTLDDLEAKLDKTFKRNLKNRGFAVLVNGWELRGKIASADSKKWAAAYKRTDTHRSEDAKIIRVKVLS